MCVSSEGVCSEDRAWQLRLEHDLSEHGRRTRQLQRQLTTWPVGLLEEPCTAELAVAFVSDPFERILFFSPSWLYRRTFKSKTQLRPTSDVAVSRHFANRNVLEVNFSTGEARSGL